MTDRPLADTLTPSQREALLIAAAQGPADVWATNTNRPPRMVARGSAVVLHRLGLVETTGRNAEPAIASGFRITDLGAAIAAAIRSEAKRTLTDLRAMGLTATRLLGDGLPVFDGWRHVGKAANGDPVYEPEVAR
jgi:hypothetical protein